MALQAKGKNFLIFVHDPSSLMGKCKEIQEVHLIVVKGKVESKDLVGVQIPMEVSALLKEFDDAKPEDLPIELLLYLTYNTI